MAGSQASLFSTLRGTRLVVAGFIAFMVLIALGRALTGAYVEILWQVEAGYLRAFWTRMAWEWGARLLAGLAVAALVFVNLKIASTTLGGIQIRRRFGNLEISEQLPKRYVTWGMLGASALLGLWFGAALTANVGRRFLFLLHSEPWGLVEPILQHDVSFYVYWVPVLGHGFIFAMTAVFLVFTLATAGYAATGALSWSRGRIVAHPLARAHLGILIAVFLVFLAGRLWLERYMLLLDGGSAVQGIFGFADHQARLPALQTLIVISLGAAAGAGWGAWKARPIPLIASFVSVLLGTILIAEFYPSLVQSFRVEPNELERETPYIEHNLEFTRIGFGLDALERRAFEYDRAAPVDWADAAQQFAGMPVWNRDALLATYQELEALFPYYDFLDVTIDRYPGPSGPVPIAISVRQVDPEGIQDRNWQNLHLRERYVAGLGAVASMAGVRSPEGRPEMVVGGIPPVAAATLDPTLGAAVGQSRPEIFFGTRIQQPYGVVSPAPGQYLAPDGSPGVPGVDYPVGIPLRSTLRTALLAWRFQDANLLFASELTDESRFIYRRRVIERAMAVAPFLTFPDAPYPVIAEGRVVWVVEAFTRSGYFPLASANDFEAFRRPRLRYVRNSYKVTVDAVTGRVDVYRVPAADPLADVYERAFPGLFRPISEMPRSVRDHVRYSRELFDLQGRILRQYHQETAPAFHGQQDAWDEPQELIQSTTPVPYRAEYGIYRLPGEHQARFQLTTVFVPAGRQNLTALLAARTDGAGVPELILVDVPVEDQVPGPRQVDALVEQDPQISQQFSLWRTGGSQVWTGHLHLVPVGERFLYLEPVFLAAQEDAIPELRRFLVSDGIRVAMTETLPDAIARLAGVAPPAPGTDAPMPLDRAAAGSDWPQAALDLLDEATSRLQSGDWQGFGEALEALRTLLSRLGADAGPGSG